MDFKQRININPVISILKLPQTSNTDDTFLGLLSAYVQVPGGLFSRPRSPVRSWLRPSVDPEASRRTQETISGTQGIVLFKGMKISGFCYLLECSGRNAYIFFTPGVQLFSKTVFVYMCGNRFKALVYLKQLFLCSPEKLTIII